MIFSFICRLSGHHIRRNRVWHDGLDFRTNCTRCQRPLIKRDQEWRAFDMKRDPDTRRKPHPRYNEVGTYGP